MIEINSNVNLCQPSAVVPGSVAILAQAVATFGLLEIAPALQDMDQAIQLLQNEMQGVISSLIGNTKIKQVIVKKLTKMVREGKIPVEKVLKGASNKQPARANTARTPKQTVFEITFSSPAIECRVEGDPYDDSLGEDFGPLVDHFAEGQKVTSLHSSLKSEDKRRSLRLRSVEGEKRWWRWRRWR